MAADLRPKRRRPSDAPRRLDPARFCAKERIGTNGSREPFVPIPYSARNARPGYAAPLPVEASAGSVCAVAFPPPHVRKNRGFGNLSPASPSRDAAVAVSGGETPGREFFAAGNRGPSCQKPDFPARKRARSGAAGTRPARRCPVEAGGPPGIMRRIGSRNIRSQGTQKTAASSELAAVLRSAFLFRTRYSSRASAISSVMSITW